MTKLTEEEETHAARAQAMSASAPVAYKGMSKEHKERVEAYEAQQEALRTGGGDTRVTPIEGDYAAPAIHWPLEQATVDVNIHRPGPQFVVHNKKPVPAPTGTATGVTPDEKSVTIDNRAGLARAMTDEKTPVVDMAKEAPKTRQEQADHHNRKDK